MISNPYHATRETMDAVHRAMKDWARLKLQAAQVPGVTISSEFPDDERSPVLVVFPYRLTLWPKLVENAAPVSLLGANPRQAAQNGVPEAWVRLAGQLTDGLRQVFPAAKNKAGVEVVLPNAPLASLPRALADWYADEPEDAAPGWRITRDGVPFGRLPTLGWMPGIKLRVHYLVQMAGPLPERMSAAGLISALTVGLHLDRAIEVERPPAPLEPRYLGLFRAVAESVPDELGRDMRSTIEAVSETVVHTLPVLPHESPSSDDFAEIMRALRRPLQPTLLIQLQVPVAGFPELLPAVTPQLSANRMAEPGDAE